MQRLEVSGAVRPIYGSLGVKRLTEAVLSSILIYAVLSLSLSFARDTYEGDTVIPRLTSDPANKFFG